MLLNPIQNCAFPVRTLLEQGVDERAGLYALQWDSWYEGQQDPFMMAVWELPRGLVTYRAGVGLVVDEGTVLRMLLTLDIRERIVHHEGDIRYNNRITCKRYVHALQGSSERGRVSYSQPCDLPMETTRILDLAKDGREGLRRWFAKDSPLAKLQEFDPSLTEACLTSWWFNVVLPSLEDRHHAK
jgi:hypothetical protein